MTCIEFLLINVSLIFFAVIEIFFSCTDLKKIIELLQTSEVCLISVIFKYMKLSLGHQDRCLSIFPILQVESIVLKRYGKDAYRIFRLLSNQSNAGRYFETDKVITLSRYGCHYWQSRKF